VTLYYKFWLSGDRFVIYSKHGTPKILQNE